MGILQFCAQPEKSIFFLTNLVCDDNYKFVTFADTILLFLIFQISLKLFATC